ncbi:uncharacterized protein RAG0_00500 [Rhynchosporium agropyri]|uniref:PLD phosphodiesterase domain-containing protein n=1 Tax=Rhynchosporium agropyri TaxID=914238 RepID=A0A1E1JSZ4_9HELO|nr:uncharacterized protein RAG0_00500 [Rhynchosporium agropyri]
MSNLSKSVTDDWRSILKTSTSSTPSSAPNYWSPEPLTLLTTSQPLSFSLGTGSQILSSVLKRCESTTHELILVTCFWAPSSSQQAISSLLLKLSAKGLSQNRKIQVRIRFSSWAIVQKLFQTSSLDGKIYEPEKWTGLGLPEPKILGGLEMEVKSVFVRPFSVMHPKFILLDRKLAFMPSCNVSWENWFEGCIEMEGEIAENLFEFWVSFWAQGNTNLPPLSTQVTTSPPVQSSTALPYPPLPPTSLIKYTNFPFSLSLPETILLPSPHHMNPQFRLLSPSPCPPTPLNTFLLTLFTHAKSTIFIQTPNLTCKPVVSALLTALSRGVSVHLITSSRLMIVEQLVTAGTITEFEVWKLRRGYRMLGEEIAKKQRRADVENQVDILGARLGELKVGYYHPREGVTGEEEPVKSHIKLVIVDEEVTVLGSGNMDRASWYTSQELGVAFFSKELASSIRKDVDGGLEGRVDYIC